MAFVIDQVTDFALKADNGQGDTYRDFLNSQDYFSRHRSSQIMLKCTDYLSVLRKKSQRHIEFSLSWKKDDSYLFWMIKPSKQYPYTSTFLKIYLKHFPCIR